MAKVTRAKTELFLLGQPLSSFNDKLLPTGKDVLRRLFFLSSNSKENRRIVVTEMMEIWKKARIPTMEERAIMVKLENIVSKYEKVKINRKRTTDTQANNEKQIQEKLSHIFDIAHKDAFSLIPIEEDKIFLMDQRTERKMAMAGVDFEQTKKEKRKAEKMTAEQIRIEKWEKIKTDTSRRVQLEDSTSSSSSASPNEELSSEGQTSSKRLKITPELVSALDRTNLSDRRAAHLLSAVASTSGMTPLSRSSIRRARINEREMVAQEIKQRFYDLVKQKNACLIIHWDGKLLPNMTGIGNTEKVDRLAILVSSPDLDHEKLLAIPKLAAGTGAMMAEKALETVKDWKLDNQIVGMSFDTTASNTGRFTGSCHLFEELLSRPLLHLPCRHHIMELLLASAFKESMGPSSGPDIAIFSRFREKWSFIPHSDKDQIELFQDPRINYHQEWKDSTIASMEKALSLPETAIRDDYKELCQLTLFCLTGELRHKIRKPGACHHARWMAKAIYAMKILMYRKYAALTAREERGLQEVTLFVILLYSKAWIEAHVAKDAAHNDLKLLHSLIEYRNTVNEKVGNDVFRTFKRHLWYLGGCLIGLCLFSDKVTNEEKEKVIKEMKKEKKLDRIRWKPEEIKGESCENVTLSRLASSTSRQVFQALKINESFLDYPVEKWEHLKDFQEARGRLQNLKVINDAAERGIAMITTFNDTLTKDEETKQALLQVVEEHRRLNPFK